MNNTYESPKVKTLNGSSNSVSKGTWAYLQDVAVGYAYFLVLAVVSQIDITP